MPRTLSPDLVEEALTRYPPPIADAVRAVEGAGSPHERRDRVVECFRALVRYAAAVAIAAHVRDGPGPAGASQEVRALWQVLVRRGLTDGQWVALCRGLLVGWARHPGKHAVPLLVRLFHGASRGRLARALDGLLAMRRVETVAHGGTGDESEIARVLERRLPQLEAALGLFSPLFRELRVVVPLRLVENRRPQPAALLAGDTPGRGRWRRLELARGEELPVGEVALVDSAGTPVLTLFPGAVARRAEPGAPEDLYLLEGVEREGARYVALPSRAAHRDGRAGKTLERAFLAEGRAAAAQSGKAMARAPARWGSLLAGVLAAGALAVAVHAWHRGQSLALATAARSDALADVLETQVEESRAAARAYENRAVLVHARAAVERDPTEAMAWLEALDPHGPGAREARLIAFEARRRGVAGFVFPGRADWISDLVYAPDESYVAAASGDGSIRVCSLPELQCSRLSGHRGAVLALAVSPDGRILASGGSDASIRLWRARGDAWTNRALEGHRSWVESLSFSTDGAWLASGSRDASVRVWRVEDGRSEIVGRHAAAVAHVVFSGDRALESVDADGGVRRWRRDGQGGWAQTGAEQRTREGASARISARAGDGSREAVAGEDGKVLLTDLRTGERQELCGHSGRVTKLVFSPDGQQLASAGVDGQVRLWDCDRRAGKTLGENLGIGSALAWSGDGALLASAGPDHDIAVWTPTAALPHEPLLAGHAGPVHAVAFAPAGTLLASAGADGAVRLWDADAGGSAILWQSDRVLWNVVFSPRGERLATVSDSGAVRVWRRSGAAGDRMHGFAEERLMSHEDAAVDARFSPDGRWLATAGWDGALRLWDLDGRGSRTLAATKDVVAKIAWSPDGRYLAAAGWDATVLLHDMRAAETLVLRGHDAKVLDVAFSPDGTRLASASGDGTIRVWQTAIAARGGAAGTVLRGHTDEVTHVAFVPGGTDLVSAGRDHSVRLWDVASGQGAVLGQHDGEVSAIAVSPDGRAVASVGDDRTVRLWPIDLPRAPGELKEWLANTTTATTLDFAAPRPLL